MKQIITSLFLLVFFNSNAQLNKGVWLVGGDISYSSTNYKSANYGVPHTAYNLQINPNIGYFIIDKFAVGIKTGYSKNGLKNSGNLYFADFNIGPFLRYYLLNSQKNFNILTEANYQHGIEKGTGPQKATPKNSFSFSAGPVMYFNTSVGLEFLLSYSSYKFSGFEGANNTVMFGVGVQVHLEKEK